MSPVTRLTNKQTHTAGNLVAAHTGYGNMGRTYNLKIFFICVCFLFFLVYGTDKTAVPLCFLFILCSLINISTRLHFICILLDTENLILCAKQFSKQSNIFPVFIDPCCTFDIKELYQEAAVKSVMLLYTVSELRKRYAFSSSFPQDKI